MLKRSLKDEEPTYPRARHGSMQMGPYKRLRRGRPIPLVEISPHMKRGPGFEVWNPYNAQHCVDFVEEDEQLVEKPFTLGHIYYCHNPVPEEIIWQQKIAEEMLDAGSIAYFQEEEEYYNSAEFMLQDSFNNHTAQRDEEYGNTDVDGRITDRGRVH